MQVFLSRWAFRRYAEPIRNVTYHSAEVTPQKRLVGVFFGQPIRERVYFRGCNVGMLQTTLRGGYSVGVVFSHSVHFAETVRADAVAVDAATRTSGFQSFPQHLPRYVARRVFLRRKYPRRDTMPPQLPQICCRFLANVRFAGFARLLRNESNFIAA